MSDYSEENNRIIWSHQERREKIFKQRRFLWNKDYLEIFYNWLDLKPGMTIADIGCGWGYMGHLLLPKILPGGSVYGVDIDAKFVKQAIDFSHENTNYLVGDVHSIPLKDESVELAICQALLMHIANPESAVKEMARIVKPGGKVVTIEPNNILAKLTQWDNINVFTPEEKLEELQYMYTVNEGRKKLKMGDYEIGSHTSYYMVNSGLVDIKIHINDSVLHLEPPYDTSQKKFIEQTLRQNWQDDFEKWIKIWDRDEKQFFLAGGGTEDEYKRRIEKLSKRYYENQKSYLKALEQQNLVYAVSRNIYITTGVKAPK